MKKKIRISYAFEIECESDKQLINIISTLKEHHPGGYDGIDKDGFYRACPKGKGRLEK